MTSNSDQVVSGCASTRAGSAVYNASFRIMWGVGVGLLVLLCDSGFGSLAQLVLSSAPMHILAKLSYCIYIFHYNVIIVWEQTLLEQVYIDELSIAWHFMAISVACVAVAAIAYLFYEMPIATLWSHVMVALVGHSNRKRDENENKIETLQLAGETKQADIVPAQEEKLEQKL